MKKRPGSQNGISNNPAGRPPAKRNFQALMRKKIEDAGVLEVMIETALKLPNPRVKYDVDDKDRLKLLETLAKKVAPDLKAVEVTGDGAKPMIILKDLTGKASVEHKQPDAIDVTPEPNPEAKKLAIERATEALPAKKPTE